MVGAAGWRLKFSSPRWRCFSGSTSSPELCARCYNTILIAGISTVLFNANPLLRFDGYYMLMDYLEIPNLRARATTYLIYLCERYLFGRADAVTANREPR